MGIINISNIKLKAGRAFSKPCGSDRYSARCLVISCKAAYNIMYPDKVELVAVGVHYIGQNVLNSKVIRLAQANCEFVGCIVFKTRRLIDMVDINLRIGPYGAAISIRYLETEACNTIVIMADID